MQNTVQNTFQNTLDGLGADMPSRNAPKASLLEGLTVLTRWDSPGKQASSGDMLLPVPLPPRRGWAAQAAERVGEVRKGPCVLQAGQGTVPGWSGGAFPWTGSGRRH